MKQLVGNVLYGFDRDVALWVQDRIPEYTADINAKALGVVQDGELVAGVTYEHWNGVHLQPNIAIDSKRWANRDTLRQLFSYPFVQLNCEAMTILVAASNEKSLTLVTKMGFELEAMIKFAAYDGSAMIVLKMYRDSCKWIK